MTRFADPSIYQCPECKGYLTWPRLASFSFFIPTTWSDGDRPMTSLFDMCSITCCPACSAILWSDELNEVAELPREPRPISRIARKLAQWSGDKQGLLRAEREWAELPEEWKFAKGGRPLEYADFQRALASLTGTDPGREIFLRRRLWWAHNHHMRRGSDGTLVADAPIAPETERRTNMMRLIELYEAKADSIPARAELLRQLGQFDEAIRLLKSGAPEIRHSATAAWTLRWAKAGDPELKTFP